MANKVRIKRPAERTEREESNIIPPFISGGDNAEPPAKRFKISLKKKEELADEAVTPKSKPLHQGKTVTAVPLPAYANYGFNAMAATAAPASPTSSSSSSSSDSGSGTSTPATDASSPEVFSAELIAKTNKMNRFNGTQPARNLDRMALAYVVDKFPGKAKEWSFKIKKPIATGRDPVDLDKYVAFKGMSPVDPDKFFAAHALLGLSRAQ